MATLPGNSLGAFLRSRRERLDTAGLDLPGSARRRTPGLRREEVAQRAGLSVEWYTRLEQGRGGAPSAQVIDSVADALLLSPAEREHVFLLAHGRRPAAPATAEPGLDPRFSRVLSGFPYGPAYIKTPAWDIIAWNRAAQLVLSDYATLPPGERNVLRLLFFDTAARTLLTRWEDEAGLAVSTFRRELTRWGATEQATRLVEELRNRSADFARMWEAHDVGTLGEGVKHLAHPVAGHLALWYSSFAIDDEPGLGLVLYTPDTDADLSRIRRLLDG
ncbi:helix-turn-helix transcriptional regulator [Actinoplanes sp. M2I2]|uniref:helix-turn-helix transcriptional regulator n=1 Tax=Actinoplanes sp. M2I2 TaxID=1734444 RepID=UPI0020216563|nr:helix-turn-helix transcriptional regulator [Actinoplanes sp. M2I2]